MTLRQYLVMMLATSLLCWAAFVFVMFNVNPFEDAAIGFVFFYLSLFMALFGTLSLCVFAAYHLLARGGVPMYRMVQKSFRASCVLSGAATASLFLAGRGWLSFGSGALLLAGMAILSIVGVGARRPSRPIP